MKSVRGVGGGSPATEEISTGIESHDFALENGTELEAGDDSKTNMSGSGNNSLLQELDDEDEAEDESSSSTTKNGPTAAATTAHSKRQLLDEKLKNFKQEKLKRKVSTDSQMLALAQEDLALKRKFMDRMDKLNLAQQRTMDTLSSWSTI